MMLLKNLSRAMEVMERVETKTETEVSMGITLHRTGEGAQGQYLISRIILSKPKHNLKSTVVGFDRRMTKPHHHHSHNPGTLVQCEQTQS